MKKNVMAITSILAITAGVTLSGCQGLPRTEALTIALTATSIDPAATLGPITQMVNEHAAAALLPGDGKVTVVTPDKTEVVDLTPMRGGDVESVPAKAEKLIAANITTLESVLDRAAATKEGLDAVGVLDTALEQTPAGGRVIIESSGFSTVAPLDLNRAGDWIGNPEGFVKAVNAADLPSAAGKHITFAGLGYPNPASAQEQAGPAARTALTKIMLGLCAKMDAASCDTINGPVGHGPAVAANQVTPVALDQIATHCVGQTSIDASIAFMPNSPVLLPAADQILAPIADALTRCPAESTINATGHSARLPGGDPGAGTELEQQRAQAVLNRLTSLGAPIAALGTATAGGQIIDNLPDGNFNEALAAKNRIVTINIG